MLLIYVPRSLIGVLTSRANTTIETEIAILLPLGFGFVNARLTTSSRGAIEKHQVDYYDGLETALDQFAKTLSEWLR